MLALKKYMKLTNVVAYNTRSALEAYTDFPISQVWLSIWLKYIAIQSSMLSKMAGLQVHAYMISNTIHSYSCITKCMQKLLIITIPRIENYIVCTCPANIPSQVCIAIAIDLCIHNLLTWLIKLMCPSVLQQAPIKVYEHHHLLSVLISSPVFCI